MRAISMRSMDASDLGDGRSADTMFEPIVAMTTVPTIVPVNSLPGATR